jgi:hypothetical protein
MRWRNDCEWCVDNDGGGILECTISAFPSTGWVKPWKLLISNISQVVSTPGITSQGRERWMWNSISVYSSCSSKQSKFHELKFKAFIQNNFEYFTVVKWFIPLSIGYDIIYISAHMIWEVVRTLDTPFLSLWMLLKWEKVIIQPTGLMRYCVVVEWLSYH